MRTNSDNKPKQIYPLGDGLNIATPSLCNLKFIKR